MLLESDKVVEAALFARSYCPSEIPAVIEKWRRSLEASQQSIYAPIIGKTGRQ